MVIRVSRRRFQRAAGCFARFGIHIVDAQRSTFVQHDEKLTHDAIREMRIQREVFFQTLQRCSGLGAIDARRTWHVEFRRHKSPANYGAAQIANIQMVSVYATRIKNRPEMPQRDAGRRLQVFSIKYRQDAFATLAACFFATRRDPIQSGSALRQDPRKSRLSASNSRLFAVIGYLGYILGFE